MNETEVRLRAARAHHQAEAYSRTVAQITRREIFGHARKMLARRYERLPNWAVAMELFGVGSTYAWMLCAEMGIDGDAYTADPFPPLIDPTTPVAPNLAQGGGTP